MQFFSHFLLKRPFWQPWWPYGNPPRGVGLGMLGRYTHGRMQKHVFGSLWSSLGPGRAHLKAAEPSFTLRVGCTLLPCTICFSSFLPHSNVENAKPFFDILASHNDQASHVKELSGPSNVVITVFGYRVPGGRGSPRDWCTIG